MANNNPSRPVFAGERVFDVVVGNRPDGNPRMLPIRITVYTDRATGSHKVFQQWTAKKPEGLSDPAFRRFIDKQVRRHVRRWLG